MLAPRARSLSFACLMLASCASLTGHPEPITTAEVQAMLDAQAAAWNRGDLETFVASYWDDPRLSFCGKSGVVHGRRDLLQTYQHNYPTAEARGSLTFTLLEL